MTKTTARGTKDTSPDGSHLEVQARLEAAWAAMDQSGVVPNWQDFLPSVDEAGTPMLAKLLLQTDIECRVHCGRNGLLTERYEECERLQQPDLRLSDDDWLDLVRWEYQLRWDHGWRAQRSDYCARFPQWADLLRDLTPYWSCQDCGQRGLALPDESAVSVACPYCHVSRSISDLFDARTFAQPASGGSAIDLSARGVAKRYRIVERHARGGLGEVFIAEDSDFGRTLALKVVRADRDDAASRERFIREAEITARLEHPGVVPVYGLNVEADGRPAYAMRFVQGETLESAIKKFHEVLPLRFHSIAFRNLLQRFIAVCNVVSYAHTRGVVHRDLKPLNIMLGKFGETLVLDWGLAKVLGTQKAMGNRELGEKGSTLHCAQATPDAFETISGRAMGTPEYMSPEQAAGNWDAVNAAADIYLLGATLYHIVTNRPPIAREDWPAMQQKIQRGDFPAPNEIVPELPRPLDAVCRKAMAVKIEDRYATAQDLATDIERWMADRPVSVLNESMGTRFRRWARNHSHIVTATLAALVVGIVGFAAASVALGLAYSREAELKRSKEFALVDAEQSRAAALEERDRASKEQRRAEKEQQTATKVKELLAATFESADPLGIGGYAFIKPPSSGAPMTVLQLLEEQANRLKTSLPDDPQVQVNILCVMGNAFQACGDFRRGEELLRQAFAISTRALPEGSAEQADARQHLGWVLFQRGQLDEAYQRLQEALKIRRDLFRLSPSREKNLAIANIAFNIASILAMTGAGNEAEMLFREAIEIRKQCLGDSDRLVAIAKFGLSALYLDTERVAEAIPLISEAKAAFLETEGLHSIGIGFGDYQDGEAALATDPQVAEQHFRRAMERLEKSALGSKHWIKSYPLNGMARAREKQHDMAGAEHYYREALEWARGSFGDRIHPRFLDAVGPLAHCLARQGRVGDGMREYERLLDQFVASFGADHVFVADAKGAFSSFLAEYGQPMASEGLLDEAIAIYRRTRISPIVGRNHGGALARKALLCYRRRDYSAAEQFWTESLPLLKKRYGEFGNDVLLARCDRAAAWAATGRLRQAANELDEVIDLSQPEFRDTPEARCFALSMRAQVFRMSHEPGQAARTAKRASEFARGSLARSPWLACDALLDRASLAAEADDWDEAAKQLDEAERWCERYPEILPWRRVELRRRQLLLALNQQNDAEITHVADCLVAELLNGIPPNSVAGAIRPLLLTPYRDRIRAWVAIPMTFGMLPPAESWSVFSANAVENAGGRNRGLLQLRGADQIVAGKPESGRHDLELAKALGPKNATTWEDIFLAFADAQAGKVSEARSRLASVSPAVHSHPIERRWDDYPVWSELELRAAYRWVADRIQKP